MYTPRDPQLQLTGRPAAQCRVLNVEVERYRLADECVAIREDVGGLIDRPGTDGCSIVAGRRGLVD